MIEGNPYAVPPTQPEVAVLRPYLQPIFATDPQGQLSVTGYVDTDSDTCRNVRSHSQNYRQGTAVAKFIKTHGYHPAQCAISSGQLKHDRAVEMEFVRQFHLAGFNLHIHVVGDVAARTAIDAIEAARAADGIATQHDALAHVQMVNPDDVARISDRLYVACTFACRPTPIPPTTCSSSRSSSELSGTAGRPSAQGRRLRRSVRVQVAAGCGRNARGRLGRPVDSRDPRPFVNMAVAITRQQPGQPALTQGQRISIESAINAYTIDGARYLNLDNETGSIGPGNQPDFIVLDRDILKLAQTDDRFEIAQTQVLQTWFRGVAVYTR